MKKGLKKLLGLGLAVSLAVGYNGTTALADSSFSETFNGTTVYASVITTSNSAIATTSYSRPATIEAIATVYYRIGDIRYSYTGPTGTNSIGGASSTAKAGSNAEVAGGKGEHHVISDSGNAIWRYTTTTGSTW